MTIDQWVEEILEEINPVLLRVPASQYHDVLQSLIDEFQARIDLDEMDD